MDMHKLRRAWVMSATSLVFLLLAACSTAPALTPPSPSVTQLPTDPTVTAQPGITGTTVLPAPTQSARPQAMPAAEAAALASLRKVDDYPLYTMVYTGTIETGGLPGAPAASGQYGSARWACSLFAALADPENGLYGRNFDWQYSPALLLFTDPPDGYASVSMVDTAYLDFTAVELQDLAALPLEQRHGLLEAPRLPFDGLNEHGLAVGMAAVPPGNMPLDPGKPTVGSLEIIREVLDHARTVPEAVALFEQYNVAMEEVPIHYLLADAHGQAALVEYDQGQMVVTSNQGPYHLATNFLLAEGEGEPAAQHGRYQRMLTALQMGGGNLTVQAAMRLLEQVSQPNTQWSIVYGLHSLQIELALGREYGEVLSFSLEPGEW